MLEYNVYDNFNPNIMLKDQETNASGGTFPKGYPKPFARGVLVDYEIWQTGYEYTSSTILTIEAHIGDIIEVLLPIDDDIAISPTNTIKRKMSIWYVVTTVDDNNKVTMQNYFWYAIEGNSLAVENVSGYASSAWTYVIGLSQQQVMIWGNMANWDEMNMEIKLNMKADTVETKELAKNLFAKMLMQPIVISHEMVQISRPQLYAVLATDEWTR